MIKNLTKISEADLCDAAGTKIFERGAEYFEDGMVSNVILTSKNEVSGRVRGSSLYKTKLELDEEGEIGCSCSCPYEGSFCKHGVALGLYLISNPQRIAKVVDIKSELLKKSKEELVDILMNVAKDDGFIIPKLGKPGKARRMTFSEAKREAEQAFEEMNYWGHEENSYDTAEALENILDNGKQLAKSGNLTAALDCFEALASAIEEKEEEVYDEEGEILMVFDEVFKEMIVVFNSPALADKERESRMEKWIELALWGNDLGSDCLSTICDKTSARYLPIVDDAARKMLGKRKGNKGGEDDEEYEFGTIISFILDLDLRQRKRRKFIEDAEANFSHGFYALIDYYLKNKDYAKAADAAERALAIGNEFDKDDIRKKLAMAQKGLGLEEEAFENMLAAFTSRPELNGYKELKGFGTPKKWEARRRRIMDQITKSRNIYMLCQIYGLEGNLDKLKEILYKTDWESVRAYRSQSYIDPASMLNTIERSLEKDDPGSAAYALKLIATRQLNGRDRESYRASARSMKRALELLGKANLIAELEETSSFIRKIMKDRWNYSALQEEFSAMLGFEPQRRKPPMI